MAIKIEEKHALVKVVFPFTYNHITVTELLADRLIEGTKEFDELYQRALALGYIVHDGKVFPPDDLPDAGC